MTCGFFMSNWVPVATHPVDLQTERKAHQRVASAALGGCKGAGAPLIVRFGVSATMRYVPSSTAAGGEGVVPSRTAAGGEGVPVGAEVVLWFG